MSKFDYYAWRIIKPIDMTLNGVARERQTLRRCYEVFSSAVEAPTSPFVACRINAANEIIIPVYRSLDYPCKRESPPDNKPTYKYDKRLRLGMVSDIFRNEGLGPVQLISDSDEIPWLSMGKTPHYLAVGRAPLKHRETAISAMLELIGIVGEGIEKFITCDADLFEKRLEPLGFYPEAGRYNYFQSSETGAHLWLEHKPEALLVYYTLMRPTVKQLMGRIDSLTWEPEDKESEQIFNAIGMKT